MYRIVIECRVPSLALQGIKEDIAMYCERFGDCRVVSVDLVQEKTFDQMSFYQTNAQKGGRYGKQ